MALARYGVLIGAFDHFGPSQQGHWYHGEVYVLAEGSVYQAAIDVATRSIVRVEYRVLHDLDADLFSPVSSLDDGYHDLESAPESGAIDYVRSPLLAGDDGGWTESNGDNAISVLQAEVEQSARLFVFGEPFTVGLGMHNVHMNQGDPPLSPDGVDHQGDDGTWQDGGTVTQRPDGSLHAVLTKFSSQSLETDDDGLPLLTTDVP